MIEQHLDGCGNGKLGAIGFCWGGSTTNALAVTLGSELNAGVPFYGGAPKNEADVAKISAPMLLHFAENDNRINKRWPAYEAALEAKGVDYQAFSYPGTRHGFHNNSTQRYNEAAANLAWERTIKFFKQHLA